jgi:hypothetical protein
MVGVAESILGSQHMASPKFSLPCTFRSFCVKIFWYIRYIVTLLEDRRYLQAQCSAEIRNTKCESRGSGCQVFWLKIPRKVTILQHKCRSEGIGWAAQSTYGISSLKNIGDRKKLISFRSYHKLMSTKGSANHPQRKTKLNNFTVNSFVRSGRAPSSGIKNNSEGSMSVKFFIHKH